MVLPSSSTAKTFIFALLLKITAVEPFLFHYEVISISHIS
jgi:hypothetical protein